jgi:hypothetical protein
MVLESGGRPRLRAADRRSWTKAKESKFLSSLADSCNVKFAARKAGASITAVYERRKANAAVRNAWRSALREGYAKLELMLLERALTGTEKVIERRDGSVERMREYSNSLAIALLRLHRDEVAETPDEPGSASRAGEEEVEEIRGKIALKLDRLNKQLTDKAKDSGEPDAAA